MVLRGRLRGRVGRRPINLQGPGEIQGRPILVASLPPGAESRRGRRSSGRLKVGKSEQPGRPPEQDVTSATARAVHSS